MLDVNILTQAEFDTLKSLVLNNDSKALTDADVVKLRELKKLMDSDILTTNEFETQKNLILTK